MIKNFYSNQRGNFALMFAIASLPVLAGVAMAIEYSNLSNHRVKLQSAVDAAALFAGKHYFDEDKLPSNNEVRDFLRANFDGNINTVSVKLIDDNVVTYAEAKAPAFFYGSIAPELFNQSAEAGVPSSPKIDVEIAMVLDTTRSMGEDGKLAALKTVASNFIDQMQDASRKNVSVEMGIVPFSNHVNVGLSNRKAPWIDVPTDTSETKEYCGYTWPSGTDMTCRDEVGYADGVPYATKVCSPTDPSVVKVRYCEMRTVETKWYGCVGSRNNPYMTTDGAYATKMPGILDKQDWHCPSELTPLTKKFKEVKKGINDLVDRGDTYMAPGVMWGLRLLSKDVPFTEGTDPDKLPSNTELKKIMIVMTDGDNSKSADQPRNAANWGTSTSDANSVTREACAAARKDGVTIYSIAFGTTISADGKSVMQDCAGDRRRYFPASDAKALKEAFDTIGGRIFTLRLAS